MSICRAGREASPETNPADTLALDVQPPGLPCCALAALGSQCLLVLATYPDLGIPLAMEYTQEIMELAEKSLYERILRMELLEIFCKADVSLKRELVTCISTGS